MASTLIQPNGQLAVLPPHEANPPWVFANALFHTIPLLVFPIIFVRSVFDKWFRHTSLGLYSAVASAREKGAWYCQDERLLRLLWKKASAKPYVGRLEFQVREGYCGSSTLRNILRSLGLDGERLPPQVRGESSPKRWCPQIEETARAFQEGNDVEERFELKTSVLNGSVPYDKFLQSLRERIADKNTRVACNFLRSALFGFERSRLVPLNLMIAVFGGHFSPIVGIVERSDLEGGGWTDGERGEENDPLVAVFDTNAKYGGVYFVRARALHRAVRAVDVSKNEPRALIFVERRKL